MNGASSPDSAVPDRLLGRLTGFCDELRRLGVPVGTGAELDLASALGHLDPLDRDACRDAAVVSLAKSPDEAAVVGQAFDRFFGRGGASVRTSGPGSGARALARQRRPPPPRAAVGGGRPDPSPPVSVPIGTYSITAPALPHVIRPLPDRDFRALRRGARRFRRDVARLPGRRRSRAHRGRVDIADTLRHSVRQGGEWIELLRSRPRPGRAELFVLWDVSGSMREHEGRFFALVAALESVSRRARFFAFSTRIEEVTDEVRRSGYRRATEAVATRLEETDGGTRIGRSLEEFLERYGGQLRPESTVVVLSDGWDLGEGERVGPLLRRMRSRVARVVWVTPYTRRPGFEPRVGALEEALAYLDALLGPEDFESRERLRPFAL